ncbi:integrase catalytic region [Caballeronia udeis]|uniref:Integrase catalytic region n=1 Tax=Caballeronia udeis TaxID=1232866 RepID=A0A158JYK0_9BURK|nr:integrase catalytic region [Caballeronia udeis]
MNAPKPGIANVLKRLHYPLEVILVCVRWYVTYPLSSRNLEEMMVERGIAVGKSWRMDGTYVKVRGEWRYL